MKGDLRALREMFIEAEDRSKRFLKINDKLMQDNELLKQRVVELENQRTLSEQRANERPRSIMTPAAMVQSHGKILYKFCSNLIDSSLTFDIKILQRSLNPTPLHRQMYVGLKYYQFLFL